MFFWIYDIPTTWLMALFCLTFVLTGWLGLIVVRPWLMRIFRCQVDLNTVISTFLSGHATFYGLILGLLAVAAFQNYSTVDSNVTREAATVASLYRDVSSLPAPDGPELRALLREYTRFVIEDAWPQQQRGVIPAGGSARLTAFQERLVQFEPTSAKEAALFSEALAAFNRVVEMRRVRLQSVTTGLPTALWFVVVIGGFILLILVWLLDLRPLPHFFLTALLALFVAAVICVIASLDYPFRGEVSVSSDAYRVIFNDLMKPE
jgi:hypothetical protein